MSRVNEIGELVREKGVISFAEVCVKMNMAPQTLYFYTKFMGPVLTDIEYARGTFRVVKD